ncbi:MAG: DUF177 domain-containing protein [Thermodesulfobacteriota bacterium]|nr:DUF177 domain-containing protein [Thermodesulfobacteriota bacterium]
MGKIKRFEDINIQAQNIGAAGVERDVRISPEVLQEVLDDEDIHVSDPLLIHYGLEQGEDSVHARVKIEGRISTICVRCLGDMVYNIDLDLETTYLPALSDMPDDLESDRVSSEFGYYRRDIRLGAFIRSELVLSLPLRYICSPDCKGLCSVCGANLNKGPCGCKKEIDPRLKKLAILKKDIRR